MSTCLAITSFGDKPSKLHNNLVKIFGTDEAGLKKASAKYEFFKSDAFKEDLGFDWQTLELIDTNGVRTIIPADEALGKRYINEQMEPNIYFSQGIGRLKRVDGSEYYVEGDPFKNLSEADVKEVENLVIFNAMGKMAGLSTMDFEGKLNMDISGVLAPGSEFYMWAKESLGFSDVDFKALRERVSENLRTKQLKMEDNDDIQKSNEEDGDEDGTESTEVRTSNGVVKVESFTINSKNTASANIKMMLSFIPEFESYTQDADGTFKFNLKEGQLTPFVFKDMDKIWRKLEDNISGIFTNNVEGEVESVLSQMMDKLYTLGQEDPTVMYIYSMLKGDRLADYKKIQFAQAFFKQKLLFFTSEVSGDPGKTTFTFFNAGVSTSKESQLRNFWGVGASLSEYYTKDVTKDKVYYKVNQEKTLKDVKEVDEVLNQLRIAGKAKVKELTVEQKETINTLLERLGIPAKTLHPNSMDKVLRKLFDEAGTGRVYNEVVAAGILLSTYINPTIKVVSEVKSLGLTTKAGDFKNPIKANKLYTLFSEVEASLRDDFSESTLMGANNKMLWSFSLPTYLDITVHKFKTGFIQNEQGDWYNPFIDQLRSLPFNKNSEWLKWLSVKANADTFFNVTFNSLQKAGSNDKAVDNKEIKFYDQLTDQINKLLNQTKDGEKSIFYSPIPSDKTRLVSFIGPNMVSTSYQVNSKGNVTVSSNAKSVEQLTGYFEDEYLRMQEVWNTVDGIDPDNITENLYVHYHLVKGKYKDEKGIPVGNGFKSQILPELSPTYVSSATPSTIETQAEKIRAILYDSKNRFKPTGIDAKTRVELNKFIANLLTEKLKNLSKQIVKEGVFVVDKGLVKNKGIDSRVWDKYTKEAINQGDNIAKSYEAALKITGDYMINGIVANIEFGKVFSGDTAYYKDTVDYNKRVPATYTDGKYLAGITNKKDLSFKVAVTQSVELTAKNLYKNPDPLKADGSSMEENFILSLSERAKYMDEKIRPSDIEIQAQAIALASQYDTDKGSGVNAADAQAWISLERWKFLKTNLDGWSPKLETAYQNMLDGTASYEEIKLAAQPLKGVYFNRDPKTGVPTYLKYSQMVLIPGMWKGTSLENLTNAMQRDGLAEVITVDGVKSGALNPSRIHNEDGSMTKMEDMKFNIYELSNLHWKLQQQLPVKGMKNDMDLGSQIQKNVISNIIPTAVYGKMDGKDLTGKDIVNLIHESISQLTDIAFKEVTNKLGTDEDGNIKFKNKLYRQLAKQLESKNMPSYIVDAIKRGYSLDAIPQVRYKAQNVLSALVNNNISKTITPGASMIQMSNVGVSKIDLDNIDPKKGIYMLKNVKSLKRPQIYINADKKASVYSGQVFLPHSFIVNHISDYRELTREQLLARVDQRLLNIIGYRIPNQKMSSIQPLEIVGILPPSMGDAIMMYSEITTQTGSDFDIDKTYIMLPEYYVEENKTTGENSLHYVSSKPDKTDVQGKKQLRNQLFELYNVLLKSPLNYADMVSGIDGSSLKNLIKDTHKRKEQAKKMTGLKMVDPFYQLGIKFANASGKSGVGLTANQMVDHVFTQIHDTVLINENIGIGNIRGESQDFSGIYDTDGKVITDTISMFLNAFVDIAKDPYISDGNFNDVTSNIVFFMLRGGVPLDFIVKFIGQPSFEEVTKTKLESESLLQEDRPMQTTEAIEQVQTKYFEKRIELQKTTPNLIVRMKDMDAKYRDISNITLETLQAMIDNTDPESFEFIYGQELLLGHLAKIEETAKPLTELILASKADVNGGGPDIAAHITNLSRYNKVIDEQKFSGLEARFAPNSMLGSKTQKTLQYLNRLDEQLFITANSGYKAIYTALSSAKRGEEYILDKKFVQDAEKEVYGFAIGEMLDMTGKYKITPRDLSTMFKTEGKRKSIADRVIALKEMEELKDNLLIQNLEIKEVKGFKFVSLDNFKNKPSSSLDAIQRGWKQLFENAKYAPFATDLVKYAFVTSGFSRNRNSIYEVIPLNVSDDINRVMDRYKDQNSLENMVPSNFLENYFRSPNGEKWATIVPLKRLQGLNKKSSIRDISNLNPDIAQKFKELALSSSSVIFVEEDVYYEKDEANLDLAKINTNGMISFTSKTDEGERISSLYKNEGIFEIGDVSYTLLSKTHKLGLNEPGLKIFENGVEQDKSFIESNNPKNYDGIKSFVNWLRKETLHQPFIGKDIKTLHSTNNVIKPSLEAIDTLTRREVMERKC